MKILIAIDHFKDGGAERVASIIVNQMSSKYDLHVVVLEPEINYELDLNKFQLHRVCYGKRNNGILKQFYKLRGIRKVIKEVRPDTILAFANYMCIMSYFSLSLNYGYRRKTKFIASERTDPSKEPANKLYARLRDYVYGHADLLICQTPWVKMFFQEKIKTPMMIIPNPISPNLPKWNGKDSHIILSACRIMPQKNLPMLLRAFALIHGTYPIYRLRILGEGKERAALEKYVDDLKLTECVEMPGFSKDTHREMTKCYMYVSSSDYEGISNSMLEALGCGVPTICTDCPVGGASMFIKDGENGLLVPVGNDKALAAAMARFIENKNFAVLCGHQAERINRELDAKIIGEKWENCILSCCDV